MGRDWGINGTRPTPPDPADRRRRAGSTPPFMAPGHKGYTLPYLVHPLTLIPTSTDAKTDARSGRQQHPAEHFLTPS
jgi:hypothetical protein